MASSAAPYQDDSPHGTACPKHYPQYTPPPLPSWRGGPSLVKVQGSAPPLPSDVINNHLHDLTILLDRCLANTLSLSWSKQSLLPPHLDLVGERVSAHGRCIDPERMLGLADLATPSSFAEAASGLGHMGFFRKYVAAFSDLAAIFSGDDAFRSGLRDPKPADRRKSRFHLTAEQRRARDTLKSGLLEGITLAPMDHDNDVIILTDSSARGIGAVILVGAERRPYAFLTLALTEAQRNYSAPDREALAGYIAITRHARALRGARRIIWVNDHANLDRLATIHRRGLVDIASARIRRWFDHLFTDLNLNLTIATLPGAQMAVADALSRLVEPAPDVAPGVPQWLEQALLPDDDALSVAVSAARLRPSSAEQLLGGDGSSASPILAAIHATWRVHRRRLPAGPHLRGHLSHL